MTVVRQDAILPGGGVPAAVVAGRSGPDAAQEYLLVRAGDRVCVVHSAWMGLDTARAVGAALFELAAEGTSAE